MEAITRYAQGKETIFKQFDVPVANIKFNVHRTVASLPGCGCKRQNCAQIEQRERSKIKVQQFQATRGVLNESRLRGRAERQKLSGDKKYVWTDETILESPQ